MKGIWTGVLTLLLAGVGFVGMPGMASAQDHLATIEIGPRAGNARICEGKQKDDVIRARSGESIRWMIVNECAGNQRIELKAFRKEDGPGHGGNNARNPFDSPSDRPLVNASFNRPGRQEFGPYRIKNHNGNSTKYRYDIYVNGTVWDPVILIER